MQEPAVTELGRAVVTGIAPGELPLFGPISRAWLADLSRVRSGRGADEALGFGPAEAAPLLTPLILTVVVQAFRRSGG